MNIYLTAIIKSKDQYQQSVREVLEEMVKQSRKEVACLQYDLHQSMEDKNVFVFYEIWESKEGLESHNQQPYIKAFGNIVDEQLQEQPLLFLTGKI